MSRYTVRRNISNVGTRPDTVPSVDLTGGWAPHLWLGAPAPGGLALPAAQPSMAWMYSPRGVFVSEDHLVVADSGNHRVLIWHGVPERDEQPADVVLGQPDGETEGPAAGGRGPVVRRTFLRPTLFERDLCFTLCSWVGGRRVAAACLHLRRTVEFGGTGRGSRR